MWWRWLLPGRLHYEGQEPVVPPVDPKRSGFVLSNRYGSNSATASNVCFNTKTSELILYRGSGGNILNKRDKELMSSVGTCSLPLHARVACAL